jgi:hypothetical protein
MNPTRQSVLAAGTECCVVLGQPRLRSVHRGSVGRVIEPRKNRCGSRRCVTCGRQHPGMIQQEWQGSAGVEEQGMQALGSSRNLGGPVTSAEWNPEWESR